MTPSRHCGRWSWLQIMRSLDKLKAVDNFKFYHHMRRESHNNSPAVIR